MTPNRGASFDGMFTNLLRKPGCMHTDNNDCIFVRTPDVYSGQAVVYLIICKNPLQRYKRNISQNALLWTWRRDKWVGLERAAMPESTNGMMLRKIKMRISCAEEKYVNGFKAPSIWRALNEHPRPTEMGQPERFALYHVQTFSL